MLTQTKVSCQSQQNIKFWNLPRPKPLCMAGKREGALEGLNGPQKFLCHRDDLCADLLPSAHTCSNQLNLSAYETYDKLKTYLLKAV